MKTIYKIVIFIALINVIAITVWYYNVVRNENSKNEYYYDYARDTTNAVLQRPDSNTSKFETFRRERIAMSKRMNEILQKYHGLQCLVKNEATETGGWCQYAVNKRHLTDVGFAHALAEMFRGKSIASFGDGRGEYKTLIMQTGHVTVYDSYDGAPNIENRTNGLVKFLDLTIPHYGLPIYDWVFSVEVAEHIPARYEDIYLGNIFRHAKEGIVLSWGTPGQAGYLHVNGRSKRYVVNKAKNNCFVLNERNTTVLRKSANWHYYWLRRNVFVFNRENRCILDETEA